VLSCHLFSGLVSSPFLHFEDPFPFEEERRERQADTKDLTSSSKVLRVLGPNLTDAISFLFFILITLGPLPDSRRVLLLFFLMSGGACIFTFLQSFLFQKIEG